MPLLVGKGRRRILDGVGEHSMTVQRSARVSRTYTHNVNGAPEDVFPLLCPVREAEYLVDWAFEMIFSETGFAERGCVFQTPNEGGGLSTWIVTEHDVGAGRIQFAVVRPDSHASTLDVTLSANVDGTTAVTFAYTHTSLTERGRAFIAGFTEEVFRQKMSSFERSLNEHLAMP